MGRNRKTNRGLPERVYVDCGKERSDGSWPKPKYYLKPAKPPRIFLGSTEAEMYRNYIKLIDRPKNINTMGDLIDYYLLNISSSKSEKTYDNERIKAKFLTEFFGDVYPEQVTPKDIYEYMDIRSIKIKFEYKIGNKKQVVMKGGKVAANKEKSMLSDIFNLAIRKGIVKDNPCRHVKAFEEKPRDRYPEDWELKAVYDNASDILRCIIDFGYLSGQRIGDSLAIQESQITEDGIKIIQSKSKNNKVIVKLLIEWYASKEHKINNVSALKDCVNRSRQLRGSIRSLYLFSKKNGQRYTYEGFKSMYNRAMQKAIDSGVLKEKFHYHDIRAKAYSDDDNVQQASDRAGHLTLKMGRVYNRKFKNVKPSK
jgi:integrase